MTWRQISGVSDMMRLVQTQTVKRKRKGAHPSPLEMFLTLTVANLP
jgi:hypothetical protein